jgi:hypothetical protein
VPFDPNNQTGYINVYDVPVFCGYPLEITVYEGACGSQ